MKKIFSTTALIAASLITFGQSVDIYSPASLPGAAVGTNYNQVITFTVPSTATISTSGFGLPSIPGLPIPTSLPANITSTNLTVAGLPNGVTGTFDQASGDYAAGVSGTLTLSGTPTAGGAFTVQITSSTSGSATLPTLGDFSFPGNISVPIVGNFGVPAAPQVFDKSYTLDVSTGIEDLNLNSFSAIQNMPNPFAGKTTIAFSTPSVEKVALKVFDMLGKEVFATNIQSKVGVNEIEFDGSNLKEGIYFYSLTNGSKNFTQKMQVKR
jgi:hypothetical protein